METDTIPCSSGYANPIVYDIPDGQVRVSATDYENGGPTSFSYTAVLSARDVSMTTSSLSTSIPGHSLISLSTSAVQSATESGPSGGRSGSVITSLETSLQAPFPISISISTGSLSLPTATSAITTLLVSDIFQPIATGSPPSQISHTVNHPVPRNGIQPQSRKLEPNKFYSNFYLGNQDSTVFLFPYSVAWSRGEDAIGSWGLAVSQTDRDQLVYGPFKKDPTSGGRIDAAEWAYFANPLAIQSIILSASELTNTSSGYPGLATESLEWGSVWVNLVAPGWLTPTLSFPLVQGCSFVTGIYHWATPLIQTGVGFSNVTYVGAAADNTTFKYRVRLKNGDTWLIYVTPDYSLSPSYAVNSFTLKGSATNLQGQTGFNGAIQIAKLPLSSTSDHETVYDNAAGAYAAGVNISGTVTDTKGSYTFTWTKQGNLNQSLLMFALPHHVSSLDYGSTAGLTDLQLMTTVKGIATAVKGDSWTLIQTDLPVTMNFAPWTPTTGSVKALSLAASQAVYSAGLSELSQDISAQTNVGSFYYDGKALAKFAAMIYALHQMCGNETLALTGLLKLEDAFAFHIDGKQPFPLIYESAWGGVVSSATYVTGDSGADFGNAYYNDHHFHYGYFVYAAAVIGFLDPTWLGNISNVAWVNTLVRDYANPILDDPYFPFSRSFDWYHGHSWAAGLTESPDGKNQESSSEDTMSTYAVKMWGQVVGYNSMLARGNLMLAIQAQALQSYYLYETTNTIEPADFIGNKAAGILFENKIDHKSYFGAAPEYVQGIHMMPIMPFSTFIRSPTFVEQEWSAYFGNKSDGVTPYINKVQGGWKGILMANYAIVDPDESYAFFNDTNADFDQRFLDGGASRTWYLAWAAALGGAA